MSVNIGCLVQLPAQIERVFEPSNTMSNISTSKFNIGIAYT